MPSANESVKPRQLKRLDMTPKQRTKPARDTDPVKRAARLVKAAESRAAKKTALAAAVATGQPLAVSQARKFTSKQLMFIKLWAEGETVSTACYKAGYVDSQLGYQMIRDPECLKLYHEHKSKYETAGQMTRKRVMDGLLEGIEMAKMMSEPAQMIAGWREVGKMCGYYEPTKHNISISVNGQVTVRQLEQKTDAELLEMIKDVTAEDVEFTENTDG